MTRLTGTDALGLMEAYNAVYTQEELTEEQIQEDFKNWVYSLVEEGHDLSEFTWEEMYEEWKQNIMEMPFPKVQITNRPGDFGASQMTLIRTPDGKEGYVNPHSQGRILSPGTTNKIMSGDLMVKAKQKSKPTTQVAHFDLYDYIKGHLIDEGYADTEQDALVIMTNMSEKWGNSILEGISDYIPWFFRQGNPSPRDRAAARAKQHAASGTRVGALRAQAIANVGRDMKAGIEHNVRAVRGNTSKITNADLIRYSGVVPPTERHTAASFRSGYRMPYGYRQDAQGMTGPTPRPSVSPELRAANRAAQSRQAARQSPGSSAVSGTYRFVNPRLRAGSGTGGGVSGMSAMPNQGAATIPGDIRYNVGPSQTNLERTYRDKYGS
jgi:hypothetical protein